MYWEEFWDTVVYVANSRVQEENAKIKFQFMLHADSKSKKNWKDMELPFPEISPKRVQKPRDPTGISDLPDELKGQVFRPDD